MLAPRFLPLVIRRIWRQRLRSSLTVAGVGLAMFLFCLVSAMRDGVRQATRASAAETTLVVYQENRFCPFTSRLPEDYGRQIASVPGVAAVVPMKVVVGNCRAALDVVTFRGVPPDSVGELRIVAGSLDGWHDRSDAALVGSRVAARRGLKPGDRLEMAGVTISVAGIFDSPRPQDRETVFTHLDFLQRHAGGLGNVTQFAVTVTDPARLDEVAKAIDTAFASGPYRTSTWSETAFTARAASDIVELASFAGWLGWGALAAVFALVANAIVLSVQDRVRDHAVLQTLGYDGFLVARLIVAESALLSLAGALAGIAVATATLHWGRFALSVEGLSVQANADWWTLAQGLIAALLLGVGAGLVPAWQAGRRPIAACFRAG